jgi:GDP-L-fucose synthase
MKKVLLTGKTGFIGRNILPFLREQYSIDAPSRQELRLLDTDAVARYLEKGKYDIIINLANPNPIKSPSYDSASLMLQDSLTMFVNFCKISDYYGKMIYAGSGAEFDKTRDICSITEEEFGTLIPKDEYGFAKYIMNELALKSDNIYNLRMFAVYGSYDHESKFIAHAIKCCLENKPVTIRQDCWFDYLHVYDVMKYINFIIENEPNHHDYNCCSGNRYKLSDIANEVCKQMNSTNGIELLTPGWNKEYTGSCERFTNENNCDLSFISLQKGIEMQIKHMKDELNEKACC